MFGFKSNEEVDWHQVCHFPGIDDSIRLQVSSGQYIHAIKDHSIYRIAAVKVGTMVAASQLPLPYHLSDPRTWATLHGSLIPRCSRPHSSAHSNPTAHCCGIASSAAASGHFPTLLVAEEEHIDISVQLLAGSVWLCR
jgi:hypothetical protein